MTHKRTVLIGDPQGCFVELNELLTLAGAWKDTRVILLGDLVDRGPDSGAVLDLAMALARNQDAPSSVLGNHEEKHLQYRDVEEAGGTPNVVAATHVETRRQLRPEHYAFMRRMPLCIRLPQYRAVAVHAGCWPDRPIERQSQRHLTHIQMINPSVGDERSRWPSKAKPGDVFWTNLWRGPERIIFGHTVFDKPLVTDHAVGLDGGACFGLWLHALILPDWEIVSVRGRNDAGTDRSGGQRVRKYAVHGDVSTFS